MTTTTDEPRGGKPRIKNLSHDELLAWAREQGHPDYRAAQVWEWLYARQARSFAEMKNLPLALRDELDKAFAAESLALKDEIASEDGATKLLFRARGGFIIESVVMPDRGRVTLCVSTQAGCAMGCRFCLTGARGFGRNLEAGEIVEQVTVAQRQLGAGRRLTNLVFMGMGEPLANAVNFAAALKTLAHERGLAFNLGRATFSTIGPAERIRSAARELPPGAQMAVSLNAPDDALRSKLMPATRKAPLGELLEACRFYAKATGQKVTFEYVLLAGVNDSPAQAVKLAALLGGIPCKVNLIPFNPFEGCEFRAPGEDAVVAFQAELNRRGLGVFVRRSRGLDIGAACGQLGGLNNERKKISKNRSPEMA
jgi:23S rRNA (adenine2503-C2)-methyltransferase